MSYQVLKLIHILSATLMIGTGFGSAFYLFFIYKRSNAKVVKDVLDLVILTDKIFTAPAVLIQLTTGIMLANLMNLTFSKWFWIVLAVSGIVFVLWIKAALLQGKMKKILANENEITAEFHSLMKYWFYLGLPSFAGAIYLYYLMVYKSIPWS